MRPVALSVRLLAAFILFGSAVYLIGQSAAPSSSGKPSSSTAAPPTAEEVKFVVALFRHGVRSPSPDFKDVNADEHSKHKWPELADWNAMDPPNECDPGNGWGYLTNHGYQLAQSLGRYYGDHYKHGAWSKGFNVYLWADSQNQRTRATAKALSLGFKESGLLNVDTATLLPTCTADPLFHPFTAGCGAPDAAKLKTFADQINQNWLLWAMTRYDSDFRQLNSVLNCASKDECNAPLLSITDTWPTDQADTCVAPTSQCKSPLSWKGRFAYASSAAEAFLLEYANNMTVVGWGQIDPPNSAATSKLRDMLKLHELYFDKTDRFLDDKGKPDRYLASIESSNLVREILDQLNRKAGQPLKDQCPRGNPDSDFVGLIGHDTNLAGVGALLELRWEFDAEEVPPDSVGLPANDALPAGALVFELRERAGRNIVRIEYVAQGLLQMRGDPKQPPTNPFRLSVTCHDDRGAALHPCEMPLDTFDKVVTAALGQKNPFLSKCSADGKQICP